MRSLMILALALLALPAQVEECFSGRPAQVRYDDGHTITIIQRHGDDVTFTQPYAGGNDAVQKTHLMLFPKQARFGARGVEHRWTSRLPKLRDLTPGYRFDLKGTMKSGDSAAIEYRNEGQVLGQEDVKMGACVFPALVIAVNTYLNGELAITSTEYLSPDMLIILRSDGAQISARKSWSYRAVAIK
jgi:hypothetical protein